MDSNNAAARQSRTDDFAGQAADPLALPDPFAAIARPVHAAGSDQILFIDSRVSNYRDLLKGLAPGTQVYVLNPDQGGLAQIAAILADRHNVADISIIAHGNSGEIELGSTIVNQASLSASAAALHTIGAAIAPGGDLLVYGCDVGEGSAGQSFVDALAATTDATVAAASHIVGDVAAGEGWNLDVTSNASVITAPTVLSARAIDAYTHPLVVNDPPAGLPVTITSFTGNTSFTESGNTTIASNGYLQLTSSANNQAGIAVYKTAIPASTGISIQFTYYSGGGTGADGISFFLLNADAITAAGGSASTVVAGGYGGGLGYSDDGQAGITNGFLGLGFDTYGNYSAVDRGQTGTGAKPNEVAIRGSGSGSSGYALLTNTAYTSGIDGTRTVKINLIKIDATHESVSVFISADGGATYQEVITNYSVNQTLPSNFYLGFAASTGGSTDTHDIENLSVTVPVALTVSAPVITYPNTTDANNFTLLPGDKFSYTYKLVNGGPNGSSEITLQDALPSNVTGVTWTLQDDLHPAGSLETGTGNINLSNINLSSGDSATVTISGTISSTASTGNASHTITATPGAGFSFVTPSTGVVGMAIGSPNPYLSGANATDSTIDTAPIQLFSTAQIADAHSNPTFTDTITLTNSAGAVTDGTGTLSGTGLTETATKGIYTLTATGVSAFNTDLESVVFTPVAKLVASGQTVVTNIATSISNGNSGTTPAASSDRMTTTDTCFLAGSHILTNHGEVVVEALLARHQAGVEDQVATVEDGRIIYRAITWVGMRHVSAAAASAADGCPIRILKGAFAETMPHRDLLVTPEHCLFVEGRLIPARMLVNHRSIIEDRTIGGYSYYHIELARHAVLLAEGLPTESYLDTGNRSCFSDMTVTALRPGFATDVGHKSWSHDACAPLAVDRETVEPIWENLDQRATMLGFQVARAPLLLSDDPRLRLLLSDGRELQPRWSHPGRHMFQIPTGAAPVRLLSRAARPAEVIGSFVDDRRELGIGVAKLVLWDGLDDTTIDAAALALPGWHALEHGIRWTGGDATLDLPAASHVDTFLDIHITATLRYPDCRAA